MGALGASGGSIANQLNAKGFGIEEKTAEPVTSGKARTRRRGRREKARVWGSLMRRKGSVVVILLASGWIGVGGKYGNAARRRSGFGVGIGSCGGYENGKEEKGEGKMRIECLSRGLRETVRG